jgi:hypothetical protein
VRDNTGANNARSDDTRSDNTGTNDSLSMPGRFTVHERLSTVLR